MSTSQLFALRNKLLKNSFQQFKKIVQDERTRLDKNDLVNLFLAVYQHESLRKQMMQYLTFFTEYDSSIVNIQIDNQRRLLQQLCFLGRLEEIRQLLDLFAKKKVTLRLYPIDKLVSYALEGKSSPEVIASVIKELATREKLPESQKQICLCLKALEADMFLPAYEILSFNLGKLDRDHGQLFNLPHKMNKRDWRLLQGFVKLYLQRTQCSRYAKDVRGRCYLQRLPKQVQSNLQDYFKSFQPPSKPQPRRSQNNKVRSTLGQNQNLKYNSQTIQEPSSRQQIHINIQNKEDQLIYQKEGNKIYQNLLSQQEKHYKYEKKMRKEEDGKKRVGIMKSEELRYYLEQEIRMEVERIKQENSQQKCHFIDLINKLKQKLTTTLEINLQVFGSFRTQLCLQQSDIDIAVTSQKQSHQMNPLQLLSQINYILQGQLKQYIQQIKFIKTATVPIIKVTCSQRYWNKKIDFTYQDISHNGLQSVQLVRQYLDLYPQLEALIFVLKKFIYISNLSAPYHGGISSYGLILMIVAYIQQEYKNHEGNGEKLWTADLLIGFLKFYGFKMNYVMKSIQIFDKNKMNWQNYTGCLTRYNDPNGIIDVSPKLIIIDPLNQNNNVGRATHKIKQIQMAFQIAYISIHTFRQCGKKRKCPSYRKISKLEIKEPPYSEYMRPCCVLKRMFNCTERFEKE